MAGLRSLVRRFQWYRAGRLELTDELHTDRPLALDELFISRRQPSLSGGVADWGGLVALDHEGSAATVDGLVLTDHFLRPDHVYRLRCKKIVPTGRSATGSFSA